MRPDGVVVPTPAFEQDLRLPQRVEDFAVEQFIAQLAVEALAAPVLPRGAGLDVECSHSEPAKPFANGGRGKFGAIIGPDMRWRTMPDKQIGQHGRDIVAPDLALDMDAQTLTAILVDDR